MAYPFLGDNPSLTLLRYLEDQTVDYFSKI